MRLSQYNTIVAWGEKTQYQIEKSKTTKQQSTEYHKWLEQKQLDFNDENMITKLRVDLIFNPYVHSYVSN